MFLGRIIRLGKLLLCAVVYVAAFSALATAQGSGNCTVHDVSTRPECPQAIAFLEEMQAAVKAGDKDRLASMVSYPLHAMQNGKSIQIRNQQQFLKLYSRLFNPAVVCAIEAAKNSDVWGNYRGFMVGRGVIWWDEVIPPSVKNPQPDSGKYPFKIISVNNENVTAPGCAQKQQP